MTEVAITLPNGETDWVDKFLGAWVHLAEAVEQFSELLEQAPLAYHGLFTAGLLTAGKAMEDMEKAVIAHNGVN